jgi:hypothetical protein
MKPSFGQKKPQKAKRCPNEALIRTESSQKSQKVSE